MSAESFSVHQFFADESSECVRRFVPGPETVDAAIHYSTSVGARVGTTVRVVIADGGDCCVWEWKREEGITFPDNQSWTGKLKFGVR